jgi:hypothetical protein
MPDGKGKKATGIYACHGPVLGDKGGNTRVLLSRKGHPESSADEKLCILTKAWNVFASRPEGLAKDPKAEARWFAANLTPAKVAPQYGGIVEDGEGAIAEYKLADYPNCGEWTVVDGQTPAGTGGIDLGGKPSTTGKVKDDDEPEPDPEEVQANARAEQLKKEAKANNVRQVAEAAPKADPRELPTPPAPKADSVKSILVRLEKDNPDKVLVFRVGKGSDFHNAYGDHARIISKVTGRKVQAGPEGLVALAFGSKTYQSDVLPKLFAGNHKVGRVEQVKGVPTVFNEVK